MPVTIAALGRDGPPSKMSEGYFRFLCPHCGEMRATVNPRNNLAHCFCCKKNLNNIDLLHHPRLRLPRRRRTPRTLAEQYQGSASQEEGPDRPNTVSGCMFCCPKFSQFGKRAFAPVARSAVTCSHRLATVPTCAAIVLQNSQQFGKPAFGPRFRARLMRTAGHPLRLRSGTTGNRPDRGELLLLWEWRGGREPLPLQANQRRCLAQHSAGEAKSVPVVALSNLLRSTFVDGLQKLYGIGQPRNGRLSFAVPYLALIAFAGECCRVVIRSADVHYAGNSARHLYPATPHRFLTSLVPRHYPAPPPRR